MSSPALSNRFADRFVKYAGQTKASIESVDKSGLVADKLQTSVGIIKTQEEEVKKLFLRSAELVKSIDVFQQQSGARQVNNLPQPTPAVASSHGKRLGYISLVLEFCGAAFTHFLEENLQLTDEIKSRERTIANLAEYDQEIPIIGEIVELSPEEFMTDAPIVDTVSDLTSEEESESEVEIEDVTPKQSPKTKVAPKPVSQLTKTTAKPVLAKK